MPTWYVHGHDVAGRERRLTVATSRTQCVLRWPPGELIKLDAAGALHTVEALAEATHRTSRGEP